MFRQKTSKKTRYEAIDRVIESGISDVSTLCRIADVSRKCYYNHLKSPKLSSDEQILKEILDIRKKIFKCYNIL